MGKNVGVHDAAINVLIGNNDIEGGGVGTVEMQKMPPLMPPIPSANISKEEEVELEMAADKQALPPEPAYSEKQMIPDLEEEDVAAAFSAEQSMKQRQSPSNKPMDKVESDEEEEDEFDSDSEFEFRVRFCVFICVKYFLFVAFWFISR